jgi:CheY-like chemotaxis protein
MDKTINQEAARTILLVEDDSGCVSLTRRYLDRANINNKVLHFPYGQQCLDFLEQQDHGGSPVYLGYVLILDLKLPDCTGIDVLKYIRSSASDSIRQIPIIMHTSTNREEERIQCQGLGADAFCVKQFSKDFELGGILQQWLHCCDSAV